MSFNIGDRVRFMRQKGEGIIRAFAKNGHVEVELSDGFTIMMMAADLVGIAREERIAFKPETPKEEIERRAAAPQVLNSKGLFLAFLQVGNEQYHYYLINNTDFDFVGTLGVEALGKYVGLWHGTIHARSYTRNNEMRAEAPRFMPKYVFRGILYRNEEHKPMPFLETKVSIVAGEFKARKVNEVPILKQAAHLFPLDDTQEVLPENFAEALREALANNRHSLCQTQNALIVPDVVDLHIEKLAPEFAGMLPQVILEKQILAFEIAMENSIAINMEGITFIHGIGNGKLKEEIARRCAASKNVAFYKEADKTNFGFGATLVKFQ